MECAFAFLTKSDWDGISNARGEKKKLCRIAARRMASVRMIYPDQKTPGKIGAAIQWASPVDLGNALEVVRCFKEELELCRVLKPSNYGAPVLYTTPEELKMKYPSIYWAAYREDEEPVDFPPHLCMDDLRYYEHVFPNRQSKRGYDVKPPTFMQRRGSMEVPPQC